MARQFLVYWQPDQISKVLKEGLLAKAASNQFSSINPGDTLWICGNGTKGELVTVGFILVNEIIDQNEANRRFPTLQWNAKFHACAQSGKEISTRKVSLKPILAKFSFVSSVSTHLNMQKPLGRQLQSKRELTQESSKMLNALWGGLYREEIEEYVSIQKESIQKELDAKHYWLLLEKSDDTRVSKGIYGYQDNTGESYHYDSLVPNYRNLRSGDFVVLRKENDILGVGEIGNISVKDDTKIHRRCPKCDSTDTRERLTKSPKWKCGKCGHEFTEPKETIVEVRSYKATIESFEQLNSPPTVKEVKSCAISADGIASQLSIIQLDAKKLSTLLEGVDIIHSKRRSQKRTGGQGFGLSQDERKAVELWAMQFARIYYEEKGWKVVDTSSSHPYDLHTTKGKEERFIEVKGTTGEGLSIILTHGEVAHVRKHKNEAVLMVVSQIVLKKIENKWIASGGKISTHEDPWCISDSCLHATQFKYNITT